MDLTKTPPALATEAAEAIRALNHLTIGLDHKGYENPAEAGATAYALRTLAERLPQTLDQLSTALVRFANEDRPPERDSRVDDNNSRTGVYSGR